MTGGRLGACQSCGATIRWAKFPSGRAVPLDAEPRIDGNVALRNDGIALMTNEMAATSLPGPRYVTHFVTCPAAATHRRRK